MDNTSTTPVGPTPAQVAANRIRSVAFGLPNQIRQQFTSVQNTISNGIPAQGSNPAVSAADIATALGSADLATVNGIISAILAALPASA